MSLFPVLTGDQPGDYEDVFPANVTDDVTDDVRGTSRLTQAPNGSLTIRGAGAEDHGYWLCHAGNQVGRALSKVVTLVVHGEWYFFFFF